MSSMIERVADVLKARGYRVTTEYPGFIAIASNDGTYWNTGTANRTWTIDHTQGDDGTSIPGAADTGIQSDCDDPYAIADGIARALGSLDDGVGGGALPLWAVEHGVGLAIPDSIAKHPQLVDNSWHNDVTASFSVLGYENDEDDIRLWVAHPDPKEREYEEMPRFSISERDGTYVFASNNEHDAEAAVAALLERCPVKVDALDVLDRAITVIEESDEGEGRETHASLLREMRGLRAVLTQNLDRIFEKGGK